MLSPDALPPVSIIIAIRNEPSTTVVCLLQSLLALDYPEYEIIVADNSDVVDSDGHANSDFICIHDYIRVHSNRIRFVRRDKGKKGAVMDLPLSMRELRLIGDRKGGKAKNLNAALRSGSSRYPWCLILDADSTLTSAGATADGHYCGPG